MEHTATYIKNNIKKLPDAVRARCTGPMPRVGADTMIELLTVGQDGWPHVAQLSVGEVELGTDGLLRVALWSHSRSAGALSTEMMGLLLFVDAGSVFEVRCDVLSAERLETEMSLTGFLFVPVDVRDKNVPYAEIVSGSRFRLRDPERTKGHWDEALSALRKQFPAQENTVE